MKGQKRVIAAQSFRQQRKRAVAAIFGEGDCTLRVLLRRAKTWMGAVLRAAIGWNCGRRPAQCPD